MSLERNPDHIDFWNDPLRIKKKDGRTSGSMKAKKYKKEHPELVFGEDEEITNDIPIIGKDALFSDDQMVYKERKYTIRKKGVRVVIITEDFLVEECETCSRFPCYLDNLWQFNGKCMDYDRKHS